MARRKTPAVSRRQSLRSTVVPSPGVEARREPDGTITLAVPFAMPRFIERISRRLGGRSGERTFRLDKVGSYAWAMFDGCTTVEEMIRRLAEDHRLETREAEVSLVAFVRSLAKRRLVEIVVPKESGR